MSQRRALGFRSLGNWGWLVLMTPLGCAKPPTAEECLGLLEHYTDKQIDQARPSTRPAERVRLLLEAQSKALTDPAFLECESEVSRSQLECAMAAATADAIERCLL